MNLRKKKSLISRTLGIGKNRISFVKSRMDEIKEIITKEDVRQLKGDGAIRIKEVKGVKRNVIKKRKRSPGNVRKNINVRKKNYVIMTRKLRTHARFVKENGNITREEEKDIRKKIRNKYFKSKAHLKDYVGGLKR